MYQHSRPVRRALEPERSWPAIMSVGEIMVWGEQTGGDATSMEQWRSFRISNLCGA